MGTILIITVNFQHADCTLSFLRSAQALQEFDRCRLLIVDNHSSDGSAERIRRAVAGLGNVELLFSSRNRGYFGAAKWALDHYCATQGFPDWLIICNNDIVFDRPDFLTVLAQYNLRSCGLLAPAIISDLTGADANPMILQRPGRIRRLRYRLLLSSFYIAWLAQWMAPFVRRRRTGFRARSAERSRIYAPHGSFLIFSRQFFERGGYIDDGFFLYGEELSVAETCSRLGLPIVHNPDLIVRHEDSQTTGRKLTRRGYMLQKQGLEYALGKYLEPRRGL